MFEPFSDLQLREMEDARKNLKRLERRDSWLWWSAITVMLLLTLAVVAVSLPGILKESDQIFQLNISLAIHALVGLVLLFNVYAVYQQWLIRRLRGQTVGHLELLSSLKIRAEEFHRLATRDPLTGLSNRRLGEERLTGEVSRSERYGHPLSVLMLDLNRFKAINDQYGHAAGDATLQAFADRLNNVIRTPSLLARLGSLEVDYQGKKIAVSSAAGWAGYENGETREQLIERADKALYAKKREQLAQTPSPRPVISRNP